MAEHLNFILYYEQTTEFAATFLLKSILIMQMQVAAGRYHTLLVHGSSVYSCGSSSCGVLGHGQEITQCAAFSRISLPSQSFVTHISASHNHTAFVVQSGEVNL